MYSGIGAFVSPVHEPGQDPHLTIRRDLETIELLDELNYDEAWVGEHHSMGWGTIGAPETVIAAASQRTRQIKLANGVAPLPWHHPFHVATRAVHLDHLTRGRYILGVGPGVPTDARMLGVELSEQRSRAAEALPTVIELVNGEERVTRKADWFSVRDAKLQLPRYSRQGLEIAMASGGSSPASPLLVGQHGISMVSFGLTQPGSTSAIALDRQWQYVEEAAEEHGRVVDRRNWRIALPVHVADTRKQALDDVREGFDRWLHGYWEKAIGRDVSTPGIPKSRELEARIEAGGALVGSVDDVVAGMRRLQEQSGGFGTFLNYVLDWAPWARTRYSLDLLAREVAPRVNGAADRPQESIDWNVENRSVLSRPTS
jgi:limonene 1,2-monooxygenase